MNDSYLDHAATTYLDPRVLAAMKPYLEDEFGNPSAIYRLGRQASRAIEEARRKTAEVLNCRPDEMAFGMKVRVVFKRLTDKVTLPVWEPDR